MKKKKKKKKESSPFIFEPATCLQAKNLAVLGTAPLTLQYVDFDRFGVSQIEIKFYRFIKPNDCDRKDSPDSQSNTARMNSGTNEQFSP